MRTPIQWRKGVGKENSVAHFEHRTLFRAAVALIVHPGGGDIGMAEHLLHLRQIRAVIEGVGGRRGAQAMCADRKAGWWSTRAPAYTRHPA